MSHKTGRKIFFLKKKENPKEKGNKEVSNDSSRGFHIGRDAVRKLQQF